MRKLLKLKIQGTRQGNSKKTEASKIKIRREIISDKPEQIGGKKQRGVVKTVNHFELGSMLQNY